MKAAVQRPPRAAGIDLGDWNWKVVRRFVGERFDLALGRSSCLNDLRRLGVVLNRPKRRLLKADPERRAVFVFRRTWATNYRKHGVGDLFDLQVEGGWEDLSVPQRFYVEVDSNRPNRASMLDRWEQSRRKEQRRLKPPVQVHTPLRVRGDDSGDAGSQTANTVSVQKPLPGRKARGYTG